jgi:hypothetical protein
MAVGGALALGWGCYVEWRLRMAQDATTQLRRAFNDAKIADAVKSEPDSDLKSELLADIKSK